MPRPYLFSEVAPGDYLPALATFQPADGDAREQE
jgi:hypothetical protein